MIVIKLTLILCSAIFWMGCAGNSGEYVLTGQLKNCKAAYAIVGKDTVTVAADGTFRYAKRLDEPVMSFIMAEEPAFFYSLILVNGTENRLEADLEVIGSAKMKGDLEKEYVVHEELSRQLQELDEREFASFAESETAHKAFLKVLEEKLAKVKNAGYRHLEAKEQKFFVFLHSLTWGDRLRDKGLPVSSDADYNRFMQSCDVDHEKYMNNGLMDYYFGRCRLFHTETGGKEPYLYALSMVEKKITDPNLRERVYYMILNDFLAGADEYGEAEKVYAQGCALLTDARHKEMLETKYELFRKLRPGADAVECELEDMAGKVSQFSDLRGKAVYLDVWATWCGPCCEEIPYMEKLAKHFRNDPRIEIVSISVDANRKAWEAKLKKDKPEWKQFLQKGFCGLYNINGIPRFMLFDKQGKIITMNAPRPSDPEITGFIESHLK